MVQISTMLATAAGYWLASSGSLFVSSTPVAQSEPARAPPAGAAESLPKGYTLSPIYWKGTLGAEKTEVQLSGYSFEVCSNSTLIPGRH